MVLDTLYRNSDNDNNTIDVIRIYNTLLSLCKGSMYVNSPVYARGSGVVLLLAETCSDAGAEAFNILLGSRV